jgi:hypothetical protein
MVVDLSSNELNEDGDIEASNTLIPVPQEDNIEKLLKEIRHNCMHLSIYHNRRYHFYRNMLFSLFRVPLIIIGGINSFAAVGLQSYIEQRSISLLNAMLSLLSAVITSVEILLNLHKRMENELDSHKSYYKLSFEIYTFINLDFHQRGDISPKEFLNTVNKKYESLITSGNAINVYRRGFKDKFEQPIEKLDLDKMTWYTYFKSGCI